MHDIPALRAPATAAASEADRAAPVLRADRRAAPTHQNADALTPPTACERKADYTFPLGDGRGDFNFKFLPARGDGGNPLAGEPWPLQKRSVCTGGVTVAPRAEVT